MPLIIINKNGIDLEEIERMQDEKDTVCLKSQRQTYQTSITRKELAENIYSSKEACEYLGITTQRLSVLVKENKIPLLKNTKHINLFLFNDLYEYKIRKNILKELRTGKYVISVSEAVTKEIKRRAESGEQPKSKTHTLVE